MKDWSRKPYRTKMSYPEMIRYTPARAFWNSITDLQPVFSEYGAKGKKLTATERRYLRFLKQSEAKKPYLADDYETMEEVWEGIPGLQDNNPHIDHPWMPDPQPTQIDEIIPSEPGIWILRAFTNDEWCRGMTQEIEINATHPIYIVEFQFPVTLQPGTSFNVASGIGTPNVTINLTVDINESGLIGMRVYLEAFDAPPLPSTQGRGFTAFNIPQQLDVTQCPVFLLHLTLANGDPIAPTVPGINVFDSTGAMISNIRHYDALNDVFVVQLHTTDPEDIDPNGYHVRYAGSGITYGITTQYPFIYKPGDMFQPADLIPPGEYTDQMHYYREEKYEEVPEIICGTNLCPDVYTGPLAWNGINRHGYLPSFPCGVGAVTDGAMNFAVRRSGFEIFASTEYTIRYLMGHIAMTTKFTGSAFTGCRCRGPSGDPGYLEGDVSIGSTDGAFVPVVVTTLANPYDNTGW